MEPFHRQPQLGKIIFFVPLCCRYPFMAREHLDLAQALALLQLQCDHTLPDNRRC
jgi:hypothetical protein